MPVKIDKIEIKLDFHIYLIIDFELFIGYPLEMLLHEKSSQGSLKRKSGETTFATLNSCPKNPTMENHLNHDPFEEMMLVSLFISPNIASPLDPFNEELLKEDIREEWSNEIIDFAEAAWIDSPSITVGFYCQVCSGIPLAVGFVGRDRLL